MVFDRRTLLRLLVAVVLLAEPRILLAKDGGGWGGHDNGHDKNDVGNDNSGGHDNGVGNDEGVNDQGIGNDDSDTDNSTGNDDADNDNGVGDDDNGSDNGIGNDDDGDDTGTADDGSKIESGRNKKREEIEWSQDKVLKERQLGRVISLTTALRIVNTKIHGRVIDVDLMVRSGKPQYRVKVRRTDGVIRTVRLDARTGKMISLLGL